MRFGVTPPWALALGAVLAAVLWDSKAPAADVKRVFGLGVAVAALGLGVAGFIQNKKRARVTLPWAAAFWFAFVVWSGVSLAWGSPGGMGALGVWAGASGLLLASRLLGISDARRAAGLTAAGVGGISALFAIIQAVFGARGLGIHGGHGNPNWLGLILALTLPLSIDLAASFRRESARAWGFFAMLAAVQVPALILARSRVAWAATLAGFVIWVFVSGALGKKRAIAAGGAAIAIAIAVATGLAVAPPSFSAQNANIENDSVVNDSDTPVAEAWEGRVWIWRASADAAVRELPFGAGLGDFADAYLDAQGERLADFSPKIASRRFLNATTAHSDWIEVAVNSGLPALFFLAGAFVAALGSAIRGRRSADAAALFAFAVCAAGDSPLAQPGFVMPFALLLGASSIELDVNPVGSSRNEPVQKNLGRRAISIAYPRAAGLIGLGCAALLLSVAASTWLGARKLTQAREGLLPEERIKTIAAAAKIDPRNGETALALGLAYLEIGDATSALSELQRSRALLANIGTDIAIGNAHLLAGKPDASERAAAAYRRALARHPGSFRAHVNLAEALIEMGARGEAEEHLAAARSIYPGHPKLALVTERLRKATIDAESGEPP